MEQFEKWIAEDQFLEHAQFVGNRYGTPQLYVDKAMEQGRDVLLDIEIQGAEQVKRKRPETVRIYVVVADTEKYRDGSLASSRATTVPFPTPEGPQIINVLKRLISEARERSMLIDATFGRKTAAVLVMDSDHVILSGLPVERLAHADLSPF